MLLMRTAIMTVMSNTMKKMMVMTRMMMLVVMIYKADVEFHLVLDEVHIVI